MSTITPRLNRTLDRANQALERLTNTVNSPNIFVRIMEAIRPRHDRYFFSPVEETVIKELCSYLVEEEVRSLSMEVAIADAIEILEEEISRESPMTPERAYTLMKLKSASNRLLGVLPRPRRKTMESGWTY